MSANNISVSSERRCFLLPKSQFSTGTSQPSYAVFSQIAKNILNLSTRENDINTKMSDVLTVRADSYYNIKYVRDGNSLTRYVDNTLVDTINVDFLDNYNDWTFSMIRWSATGSSKMKNVKIKAL